MEEIKQLSALVEHVLQGSTLFLVEVELKGSDSNRLIWVYLESEEEPISLDQCAGISRELQLLMDAEGWHERRYTLNVSSPGLDRPLKDRRQYVNNIGRKTSVIFKNNGESLSVEGILRDASTDVIQVETDGNNTVQIPFSEIIEAKIVASFK